MEPPAVTTTLELLLVIRELYIRQARGALERGDTTHAVELRQAAERIGDLTNDLPAIDLPPPE